MQQKQESRALEEGTRSEDRPSSHDDHDGAPLDHERETPQTE